MTVPQDDAPAQPAATPDDPVSYNTNSNGGVYGNLSRVNSYATLDTSVAPLRYTTYYYAIRDDATVPPSGSPYIVDRSWAEYSWYGAWQSLAYTAKFYDGANRRARSHDNWLAAKSVFGRANERQHELHCGA